ncbi:adenine phosphoribosyltransferase [Pseudolysinimonas sp.]|uniref:adenine phosphoribosyltransferase n=1 Tax=Pseudolysinimonas sp. TaxID=2680009 RepID=UPI003F7E1B81
MRAPTLVRVTAASDALDRLTAIVPDFPEPGIVFRDLTPVLADPVALRAVATELAAAAEGPFDAIAGVEARGFALAAAAAAVSDTGLVLIRKAGKLPRPVFARDYALEYGTATLELHRDELPAGSRVLLVDDVLATGGTLGAALGLLADASLEVVGVSVALELAALGGRARLGRHDVRAISVVE